MFVFLFAFQLALADSAADALEYRSTSAEGAQPGIHVLEQHVEELVELDLDEGDAPARRLPPSDSSSSAPNPTPPPTPPPSEASSSSGSDTATPAPTPAPTSEASMAFFMMGTIALQA